MIRAQGVIDLSRSPDGRLRQLDKSLVIKPTDPLIPQRLVERFGLRTGQHVAVEVGERRGSENGHGGHGHHRRGKPNHKSRNAQEIAVAPRVEHVVEIEGKPADQYKAPMVLEECTSIDPRPRMKLEYPGCPPACRLMDLLAPIGFGQRGMIVSPPKAGKTILLQQIANALSKNHPEAVVQALLVDERPEEVTDFRRNVPCEVIASSNDHTAEKHIAMAMVAVERAKRMAEQGKHVVILLDSLTRLGRAFNTAPGVSQTGRTLSGGLDASALAIPKQLFGAARNTEEAGSLTIIATCLVDTGSRGDQVIGHEPGRLGHAQGAPASR